MDKIWMGGLLSIGVLLGALLGLSAAAAPAATKVTCKVALADQPPAGSNVVMPAAEKGAQYGSIGCEKQLGRGVRADAFKLATSGERRGGFQDYFPMGTLRGTYKLKPADSSPPTSTSFAASKYTGKVKVLGGTGTYKGAAGQGKLTCSSPDGVHMSCVEHLKLAQL